MKSAAAYTNKRRVMAEAGNTKVEQIGEIATNYGRLQPVLPSQLNVSSCGPDFTQYTYFKGCRNIKNTSCNPSGSGGITLYTGGNQGTNSTTILSGGNQGTNSTNILSGGNV